MSPLCSLRRLFPASANLVQAASACAALSLCGASTAAAAKPFQDESICPTVCIAVVPECDEDGEVSNMRPDRTDICYREAQVYCLRKRLDEVLTEEAQCEVMYSRSQRTCAREIRKLQKRAR